MTSNLNASLLKFWISIIVIVGADFDPSRPAGDLLKQKVKVFQKQTFVSYPIQLLWKLFTLEIHGLLEQSVCRLALWVELWPLSSTHPLSHRPPHLHQRPVRKDKSRRIIYFVLTFPAILCVDARRLWHKTKTKFDKRRVQITSLTSFIKGWNLKVC